MARKAGHREPFDPEPIGELPADEPASPGWLPAVGVALFVAVCAWWMTGDEAAPTGALPVSSASAPPSVDASAPPPGPPGMRKGAIPNEARREIPAKRGDQGAPGSQPPVGPTLPTDPKAVEAMRKRIEEQRRLRPDADGKQPDPHAGHDHP